MNLFIDAVAPVIDDVQVGDSPQLGRVDKAEQQFTFLAVSNYCQASGEQRKIRLCVELLINHHAIAASDHDTPALSRPGRLRLDDDTEHLTRSREESPKLNPVPVLVEALVLWPRMPKFIEPDA